MVMHDFSSPLVYNGSFPFSCLVLLIQFEVLV
jgi:hypothetical protein